MITLTEKEIEQLTSYLLKRPLEESYLLFNMIINKVKEVKNKEEEKIAGLAKDAKKSK